MKDLVHAQKVIYPDLLEVMQKRYMVLNTISLFEPIGRRGLIEQTHLPERYIRNEIELLKEQQLIQTTSKGMFVTKIGQNIIADLYHFNRELLGIAKLEEKLKKLIGIQSVIIVPGNSDSSFFVKQELGKATVQLLIDMIQQDVTIAVTGGTTMAAVAEAMVPLEGYHCLFVPARGGIGEKVEHQANTIVAKMAHAEKGNYHLLHVPDPLSETLYQSLMKEEQILESLKLIQKADIVIHGIGEALTMASRRKTSQVVMNKLVEKRAVSEAFGYYFDIDGYVVHKVRTLGIQLEDLPKIKDVITVAGGESKAQAIVSYMMQGKSDVLITDEAAAIEILKEKLGGKNNDSKSSN